MHYRKKKESDAGDTNRNLESGVKIVRFFHGNQFPQGSDAADRIHDSFFVNFSTETHRGGNFRA